jgi:hypothetical protein
MLRKFKAASAPSPDYSSLIEIKREIIFVDLVFG